MIRRTLDWLRARQNADDAKDDVQVAPAAGHQEPKNPASHLPRHSPGPFRSELQPESSEILIVSDPTGEIVARIPPRQTPDQYGSRAATENAALVQYSWRLVDTLEVVLEREGEPVHPLVADHMKDLHFMVTHGQSATLRQQERDVRQQDHNIAVPGESTSRDHCSDTALPVPEADRCKEDEDPEQELSHGF